MSQPTVANNPGVVPPPVQHAPGNASLRPPVPASPAEQLVAVIGRAPAAVGRLLDRLAKAPAPFNWPVRLFSSVWLGILWLFLIGVYIAIGSGFASLRARLEMTDLEFFDAWPMVTLLILLALNLSIVTLRRIPFTLYKLGVWTVHIGILTLIAGSFIYFSQKREGSVRIFLNQSVGDYYDATQCCALYLVRMDPADPTQPLGPQIMVPLPHMPIYYERLRKNPPDDLPGQPLDIPIPPAALASDPQLQGLNIRITGYYPYAELIEGWTPGPDSAPNSAPPNPAIKLGIAVGSTGTADWLLANSPATRVMDSPDVPFGIEYVYHPTPEQLADLSATFAGNQAITVRVPKFHITRTYVVEPGKPIPVEGTPYTLTPGQTSSISLLSKGYEGLVTTSLSINVVRKDSGKDFTFERQALFRFPERSPDFIKTPEGRSKRVQDRVDNDLQISFLDASRDQFWIVEDIAGKLTLHRRAAGGQVDSRPLALNLPEAVTVGQTSLAMMVLEHTANAVPLPIVEWVPPEKRERRTTPMEVIAHSVINVDISRGDWHTQDRPVPFVQFAATEGPPLGPAPTTLHIPGIGPLQLLLSTTRRPLPSTIKLTNFQPVKYPGAMMRYEDYISTIAVTDKATNRTTTLVAQLNSPAEDHGLYLFQSEWDGEDNPPPERRFTVLGVGNRPGVRIMVAGAILMVAGILYAFYVKPLLLRRRKEQLAAFAVASAVAPAIRVRL